MKKLLILILALLISLSFVNAAIFATLAMQGLSFADPKTGEAVSNIVYASECVSNPLLCAQNKFTQETIGKVQGQVYKELCDLQPEACKAFNTAKQIQGQIGQAGQILKELDIDEKGVSHQELFRLEKGPIKKQLNLLME